MQSMLSVPARAIVCPQPCLQQCCVRLSINAKYALALPAMASPITGNVNLALDGAHSVDSRQHVDALNERIRSLEMHVAELGEQKRALEKELKDEKEKGSKKETVYLEPKTWNTSMTVYCSHSSGAKCFHHKKACAGHSANVHAYEPCSKCVH